jgi:hypothetical protein
MAEGTSVGRRSTRCWSSGESRATPHTILDMDTENKARGSLAHFFPTARKITMHTPGGLDGFVDVLNEGASIGLAPISLTGVIEDSR